uniref:Ig-like domain-containing protein n=1 Tax=Equus caballus TaxID=9796 RepID=A0A9L0TDC5_HORSE
MLLFLISTLGIVVTLRDARAQSVTQPDGHVLVSEAASLELRCNYSYGAAVYLFWYVQYPRQGLQLLLKHFSGQDTRVPGIKGFEAEFRKSNSSFNLRKSSAHWSDSAEYFCAVIPCHQLNHIAPKDHEGRFMQIGVRRRTTSF